MGTQLPLQRKPLEIGAADDSFEREADRVAEHVRRAGRRSAGSLDDRRIGSARAKSRPPIVEEVLQAPGEPLAPATRAYFEPKLAYDLHSVRLHSDDRAARSADAVRARAYTVGDNIVFGRNQYRPDTGEAGACSPMSWPIRSSRRATAVSCAIPSRSRTRA